LLVVTGFALRVWYASGWLGPGRFWDENVQVENVVALIQTGKFAPANGFYPTLAYAPQAVILGLSNKLPALLGFEGIDIANGKRITPEARMVCRTVAVIWGILGLVMTYMIGARLFSPQVGLVGTAFLWAVPWHVHASANFKPDSLVTFLLLVTFYWSLSAVSRPSLQQYSLVGLGTALSVSAKFTAVSSPFPLILAALFELRRTRRVVLYLIVAGLLSIAVFLLLNPQLDLFVQDFGWTARDYRDHAMMEETSRAMVVLGAFMFLFEGYAHGAVVAVLGIIGLMIVIMAIFNRMTHRSRMIGWVMFLTFPVVFVLSYSAGTPRLKVNNFLPVLPFSSLLASVAVCAAFCWAARRWPWLNRGVGGGIAIAVLICLLTPKPFAYVYRSMVPSTEDAAGIHLWSEIKALPKKPVSRLVYHETTVRSIPAWEGYRRRANPVSATHILERLDTLPSDVLDRADGEVFLAKRLEEEGAGFYEQRLRCRPGSIKRFSPDLFRLRGPELVVITHPWRMKGPARSLEIMSPGEGEDGMLAQVPPDVEPGQTISFVVWIGFDTLQAGVPQFEIGSRSFPLLWAFRKGKGHFFVTGRFELNESKAPIVLRNDEGIVKDAHIDIYSWKRPGKARHPQQP
ncbi:ArnT family glycosyltransferase, partial [Acidobacteriota bacterium]